MSDGTIANPLVRLIRFLEQLEEHKIHYDLKHVRDSIMIMTYVPEGVWEIEFMEDGTLEVEFFKRSEGVETVSEAWLDQFIQDNKD